MPIKFFRELRKEGPKKAWASFRRRRHLLPLAGYLILAVATAYTFNSERQHSAEARQTLAVQTHQVLVKGCVRGNELRFTLQKIIRNSSHLNEEQLQKALASGQITQAQVQQAHKFTKETLKDLAPINCSKAYPNPKE